jgi:hypothetical protein
MSDLEPEPEPKHHYGSGPVPKVLAPCVSGSTTLTHKLYFICICRFVNNKNILHHITRLILGHNFNYSIVYWFLPGTERWTPGTPGSCDSWQTPETADRWIKSCYPAIFEPWEIGFKSELLLLSDAVTATCTVGVVLINAPGGDSWWDWVNSCKLWQLEDGRVNQGSSAGSSLTTWKLW